MSDEKKAPQSDKTEGKDRKPKKPPEYKSFESVLKKAVKAPPLRRSHH